MSERPRRRAAVAAAVAMTSPARKRVQRPQDKKSSQQGGGKDAVKDKVGNSVTDLRHCWHFAALVQVVVRIKNADRLKKKRGGEEGEEGN